MEGRLTGEFRIASNRPKGLSWVILGQRPIMTFLVQKSPKFRVKHWIAWQLPPLEVILAEIIAFWVGFAFGW